MRFSSALHIQIAQFAQQLIGALQQMRTFPSLPTCEAQLAEQHLGIMERHIVFDNAAISRSY